MVRTFSYVPFVLALLISSAHSEWVSLKNGAPAAPSVTLLRDDHNGMLLRVDVSGFDVNDIVVGDNTYQSIDLRTDICTRDVGSPELPYVAKILAVPDRAAISVEVVEQGEEFVIGGYTPPPARPSWKEGDPEPPYEKNADAYRSNAAYPAQMATADPPVVFRDFRIVRLAAYPVRYVAARNELRIASSLTVRVTYGSGEVINPKTSAHRSIAPSYGALYRSTIFNYQAALDREYGGLETGRDVMLCIVPDAFYNSLLPFAAWRNKTGTQVVVKKFSDIGANATNPDIIRNYIAQVYHTWEYPPTYILLGGGYGYVPIKQLTYDYTIVNENYYVEVDGNDFIPEIMIGRFTHKSEGVEQVIVNKIVGYERNPYTASTAWFKKGAVAGNDEYASALATKRFTRDRMMLDGGFTQVDTFMNHSPCYSSLTDLLNVLTSGRSFLNYRGEGWYTGWAASCYSFSTSNVSSLNNGRMLTFVTSIGCGVAAFNQYSCFGEAWLELGSVSSPRGAVTFVGPTSNTHTAYNNKIDVGIYVGMFREGLETPGQALMRGWMLMYEVFGNERWTEYMTRVYCILGDPSAHIWRNIPRPVAVSHPASIPLGYNEVVLTVTDSATGAPVRDAQVCLAGTDVYATRYTDPAGNVRVPVVPEAVGTLTVLVRGGEVIPYEGSLDIMSDTVHVAPFGEQVVVDLDGNLDGKINPNEHGQITFTLKNWGTQAASDVQATLSVDTTMVQLETTSPVYFGTLEAGDSAVGSPFQFSVKPNCAVGDTLEFHLQVASTNRSWEYVQPVDVTGCRLRSTGYVVDDRALPLPNARMDPGETVRLYLTLRNVGEDSARDVQAILRTDDPYITILDSLGAFGTVLIDSSSTNYAEYFAVKVNTSCPTGHMVPFSALLYTQNGSYPYQSVDTFSIGVSVPQRGDPTGPDAYGYYAFASDDTMFQQAPRYNWMEISTVGTRVTGTGGNFTSTVNLPFNFKYYGVSYTQIRISSDGWIALGSGTQTASTQYCLPHNDLVNSMVAAFWDDLFFTVSLDSQKVLYYFHEPTQRFIVEWYYVGHNNSHIGRWNRETFQIILHNPASYPTPTGDGEILMQYKNTAYPVECTVGLENPAQGAALQYICADQPRDESVTMLRDGLAILYTTQSPQLLVGVHEPPGGGSSLPDGFMLAQNYPNPFNPMTVINFQVPTVNWVTLKVFDVLGREVTTLVNDVMMPGQHTVTWDAGGHASGVYFYRLQTPGFVQTNKLILLR